MIKVAVLKVNEGLSVQEIDGGLDSMQKLVGGLIEILPVRSVTGLDLVCNEEGKLLGLPTNFKLGMDHIVGDVFFTRNNDEGEPVSLTDEDLKYLNEWTSQLRGGHSASPKAVRAPAAVKSRCLGCRQKIDLLQKEMLTFTPQGPWHTRCHAKRVEQEGAKR